MSSSDDDFVADINVTPFVDVMLVLLIIFASIPSETSCSPLIDCSFNQ